MADKHDFQVTKKAGHFVAGLRSPGVGKIIRLTKEQAKSSLILGEIADPAAVPAVEPVTTNQAKSQTTPAKSKKD